VLPGVDVALEDVPDLGRELVRERRDVERGVELRQDGVDLRLQVRELRLSLRQERRDVRDVRRREPEDLRDDLEDGHVVS